MSRTSLPVVYLEDDVRGHGLHRRGGEVIFVVPMAQLPILGPAVSKQLPSIVYDDCVAPSTCHLGHFNALQEAPSREENATIQELSTLY